MHSKAGFSIPQNLSLTSHSEPLQDPCESYCTLDANELEPLTLGERIELWGGVFFGLGVWGFLIWWAL